MSGKVLTHPPPPPPSPTEEKKCIRRESDSAKFTYTPAPIKIRQAPHLETTLQQHLTLGVT